MKKSRVLKEQLNELFQKLWTARMHYEIFHVFTNEIDRPKFVDVMNRYIEFFRPTITAHFGSMVTSLGTIYDKTPQSIHLSKLIKKLQTTPSVDQKAILEVLNLIQKTQPLVQKTLILRNNVIAHLLEALTVQEVFEKAQVTRYNFRELIDDTERVLQEIGRLIGESYVPPLSLSSEKGTRAMLYDLWMFRECEEAHPEEMWSFEEQLRSRFLTKRPDVSSSVAR